MRHENKLFKVTGVMQTMRSPDDDVIMAIFSKAEWLKLGFKEMWFGHVRKPRFLRMSILSRLMLFRMMLWHCQ